MKKRIFKTIFFLIMGILFILGYSIFYKKTSLGIPCIFHLLTGFYCPGCGITRMLFALLKFDFKKAFSYNQLVFIMLPFLLIYVIYKIYLYIFNKEDNILVKIPNYVYYVILGIVICFGVIRNFSCFPFLRP